MEISVQEFLGQLGQEFLVYSRTFIENEFKDGSSLRAMDIDNDLDIMFANNPLPLGHKRKIQLALRNLFSVTSPDVPINNLPIAISSNLKEQHGTQGNAVCDDQKSSMGKIKEKYQEDLKLKEDEMKDLQIKRRSLDMTVCDPDPVGPFKNTRCGNCHLRGHKADGNRGNKSCNLPACSNWKDCGQKEKHPEYKRECKQIEKEIKSCEKDIEEIKGEMSRLSSFQEKASTSFISVVKERLRDTNKQRYMNTNILMRDVIALKDYYKNVTPTHHTSRDKEEFGKILTESGKKSLARFKLPKESSSLYDDISEDEQEPPTKKKTSSHTKPAATITSPQQAADMSSYNTFGYYPSFYGFNPYYYSAFAYQQNLQMQPPLPLDPPPTMPPQPDSE